MSEQCLGLGALRKRTNRINYNGDRLIFREGLKPGRHGTYRNICARYKTEWQHKESKALRCLHISGEETEGHEDPDKNKTEKHAEPECGQRREPVGVYTESNGEGDDGCESKDYRDQDG